MLPNMLSTLPNPLNPSPPRSYPLYARHPLWRRVIGQEAATTALKAQVQRSEGRAAAAAEGGSSWEALASGKQASYH